MTPKEKGEELVNKYHEFLREATETTTLSNMWWQDAKKLSLMLVDEVIKNIPMYTGNVNPSWEFWKQVRSEIEVL